MNQFPVLNFQDFITNDGEQLTTDSRKVAAVFGKRHDHVLRAIANLLAKIPEKHRPIFGVCFENSNLQNGKPLVYYKMTKDALALLAMGFTGDKALSFKLAFIEAFNAMADFIKNQRYGLQCRYFELQLEHKGKKAKASICGRGLNEWKGEKPVIETALKSIEEKMNPQLPFPSTVQ